jgi:predicted PurR-regulated permease PerM
MVANKNIYIDQLIRLALILAIIAWSFQMLYPLLGILAWGFIIAVVLYPFYVRLNHSLKKPMCSATIITLLVLLLVIGVTIFLTNDMTRTVGNLTTKLHSNEYTLPAPPETIEHWPLIGEQLHQGWLSISTNFKGTLDKYSSVVTDASKYILTMLVHASRDLFLFIISVIFSGFLLVYANNFMTIVRKFAKRVADDRGTNIINLIKSTIQNISRGVIGISLLQTFIFGLLLFIADVPGLGLLCLLGLILSIIQLGLIFLIIPVIIWLFFAKSFALALIISILLLLTSLIDSFLKPIVLGRGLQTPTMVIFVGVIGGVITYGFIGIFIGPVVLAIAYDLIQQWIE